jgi:uncharacterized membrane protein YeiH
MNATQIAPVIEHAAIAVSAISGVLAAKGKRIDLFGALVLGLVTAFGGGTVRDLLVGDTPVAWLRGPTPLLSATITTLATFFLARFIVFPQRALLLADAFALALFVVVGTRKGLYLNLSAPVTVLLGVVTGVAGGILRDVLTGEVPLVFRPEIHLYATAAFAGSSLCVIVAPLWGIPVAMLLGAAVVLALRLIAMRWKVSLPVLQIR